MDLPAETTFLIDLWREQRKPGPATAFAHRSRDLAVGLPWVVVGEFLSGGVAAGHDVRALAGFLGGYAVVHSADAIVRRYADLYAEVRRKRMTVGPNDLWIAACALSLGLPLITRNAGDFGALSGLTVLDYAAAPGG